MAATITETIKKIATVDIFRREKDGKWASGLFIGRPFYLDYDKAYVLMADSWKQNAKGVPQGSLLLAYYENEATVEEALLLRVLRPTNLPTYSDVVSSMVEYYKDNLRTSGTSNQLDSFTRYEFGFSGLECRVLGTFYKTPTSSLQFGADVENFYSAHNYSVIKPNKAALELIVNLRDGGIAGKQSDIKIGTVRFSSSRRFQEIEEKVPVYVSPADFLGKRTALFGMTRTGKSNTVKKIIEATVQMSSKATGDLSKADKKPQPADALPLDPSATPRFPIGQIIFDVNGEYANANLQDEGTAIYEIYKAETVRYSVMEKPDFKVMKVNFYEDVPAGFDLICSHLQLESGDYVQSFTAVDMQKPADYGTNTSARIRYDRRKAAYMCCLHRAGFPSAAGTKVIFTGNAELNALGKCDPSKGVTLDQATVWWSALWDNYDTDDYFADYKSKKGHEWADEDLKAILVFLSRKKTSNGSPNLSGYTKLRGLVELHTATVGKSFSAEIMEALRAGKIVIVDLSQGNPEIQRLYSERICKEIFADSMRRFVEAKPNNFVQFYFEEAHNLFPKKEDKDLSQIYNRLAKEGAKMNLGLIYATQEVSSISGNILKNTQNWFIAHLNNDDEVREIKKFYDYEDFTDGLSKFSASSDKGFVRMKSYSNPFIVPIQVDRFVAPKNA